MYDVDMTRPFPYTANPRSVTLLAYLNDVKIGGGGETEFMMSLPRPLRILPREGAALVWANCELENAEVVDTRRGEAWDEGKCMGGGGMQYGTAYSPEPCVSIRSGRAASRGKFAACISRGRLTAGTGSGR